MTKRRISEEQWRAWLAKQPPLNPLPPRVRREIEHILSGVARRLFLDRLERERSSKSPSKPESSP